MPSVWSSHLLFGLTGARAELDFTTSWSRPAQLARIVVKYPIDHQYHTVVKPSVIHESIFLALHLPGLLVKSLLERKMLSS